MFVVWTKFPMIERPLQRQNARKYEKRSVAEVVI